MIDSTFTFQCGECDEKFNYPENLLDHFNTKHKDLIKDYGIRYDSKNKKFVRNDINSSNIHDHKGNLVIG